MTAYTMEGCHPDLKVFFMRGGRGYRRRGAGFGPWGGFAPGHFGGRHKAGRGDIRAAILALLPEGPMHGYPIIREIGEGGEGARRPGPRRGYPTPQPPTDGGALRPARDQGNPR